MPKVKVCLADGTVHDVSGDAKSSLMEAIRASGVGELLALCGGGLSCGTCHVYVLDQDRFEILPEMTIEERELLESFATCRERSRLSCQIDFASIPDGLRIEIAPGE